MPANLILRRSHQRGRAEHGWLHSRHTFSFADYFEPNWMGFRALRVINDDRVAPGAGFPTHPHRDMEIVSYVLDGALEHKDSMGTGSVIRPGDVQRMSAGTGIRHSEYNHSKESPVHFLQIWIEPEKAGIAPGYEQRQFTPDAKRGKLALVASRDGRAGSVTIHADASIYAGLFRKGESASFELAVGRAAWIHVARGAVLVEGEKLEGGDAAAVEGGATSRSISVTGETDDDAEVLLFDLA